MTVIFTSYHAKFGGSIIICFGMRGKCETDMQVIYIAGRTPVDEQYAVLSHREWRLLVIV